MSDIVELSYNKLPDELKDCLLYFAVFSEDYEISVWKLIRLWIAEGLIQGKNLEETVEEYLKDLISRNLVMVIKRTSEDVVPPLSEIDKPRRLCMHSDLEIFAREGMNKVGSIRSLLCFSKIPMNFPAKYAPTMVDELDMLRVMESEFIKLGEVPRGVTRLFHLRAPNLKRLGIQGNMAILFEKHFLGRLNQLEKLKLVNTFHDSESQRAMRFPELKSWFPAKLTMLTIARTSLDWKHMSTLERMEALQVLKLKDNAFTGMSWEAVGGGFHSLHFLFNEDTKLLIWKASYDSFPKLRSLVLRKCKELKEIPDGVVGSLEKLDIEHLSASGVEFAKKIDEMKNANQGEKGASRFKLTIGTGC
ncbi:probable disease resistance RPP8-like protein 2 [Salvia hispanica]|uniref:probable disease resistance RPP8-like protein 2 n=1 Tax=Salvia hispanica TaxID=49212 RepID=UPI00200927AB|nr:probable disease resistance RPP8-like protein 2 [Salvia hispanica]